MSIQIANTGLGNSFDTWRLNTNEMATIISNNVVTVGRTGADRQSFTVGNGHVHGTFTANELRTSLLKGGNTSVDGDIVISSNTTIGGDNLGTSRSLTVYANTTFSGNVIIDTIASEVFKMGQISRVRINGGTVGQFLQLQGRNDTPEFVSLKLRDVVDMSTNSSNFFLSAANTSFSDNGDSPKIVFSTTNSDTIEIFLAKSAGVGDSDLNIKLVDTVGDSKLTISDSSNTVVATISSDGSGEFTDSVRAVGFVTEDAILPDLDDQRDLGSSSLEFKDAYIDGVAYVDELSLGIGASQGVSTSMIPKTSHTYHLGSTTRPWRNTFFSGAMTANTMTVRSVDTGALTVHGESALSNTTTTKLRSNNEVEFLGNLEVDGITRLHQLNSTTLTANGISLFRSRVDSETLVNAHAITATTFRANNNVTLNGDTLTVTGNSTFSANVTVSGEAVLNGNVVLGSASTDTITLKGNFANQHTEGRTSFANVEQGGTVSIGTKSPPSGFDFFVDGSAKIDHQLTVGGNLTVNKDLSVGGNLTIPEGKTLTAVDQNLVNLNVSGNTTIGTDGDDQLHINSAIHTDLVANSGGQHDLGSTASNWHRVYANNVYVANNVTIGETLTVSGNTTFEANVVISEWVYDENGNVIFDNQRKLHANNTIAANVITSAMLSNTDINNQFDQASRNVGQQLYGSSTLIPVITVNRAGQIVKVTNTAVAGVSDFSYVSANLTFEIDTADGNAFKASIANNTISSPRLEDVGSHGALLKSSFDGSNTIQTFGSSTLIPQVTVNAKGQVVQISNVAVAGVSGVAFNQANSNLKISTADGATFDVNIHDGQPSKLEGTSSEVTVTAKTDDANTYVVGLPDDVTISGQLTVNENAYISGNLFVGGVTTSIDTSTVTIEDNIIILNKNVTGDPLLDSGFEVERGDSTNKRFVWDESEDKWSITGETLIGDLEGNADTATALETARNFSITGDVTASAVSFDGTQNVSLTVDIDADTITSRELNSSVAFKIYDQNGVVQKTLYGSGS
jgi:hypothetical protein